MSYGGRFQDGSDREDSSGKPRSSGEALARAAAGSVSRAAVSALPRSRSPLPASGRLPLGTRPVHRRGHPVAGPLQVSASMQRLRAMLADLPEPPGANGTGAQPTAAQDVGTGAAGVDRGPSAGIVDSPIMLGYGEIDCQLQRAVDLLGLLGEAFRAGDRPRQAGVLTDLVAWLRVHFAFEEALMDSYQLPDMAGHKAHHHAFLAKISTLAARFEAGTAPFTSEALARLRTWLKQHIAYDDVALVTALNVRRVPSAI